MLTSKLPDAINSLTLDKYLRLDLYHLVIQCIHTCISMHTQTAVGVCVLHAAGTHTCCTRALMCRALSHPGARPFWPISHLERFPLASARLLNFTHKAMTLHFVYTLILPFTEKPRAPAPLFPLIHLHRFCSLSTRRRREWGQGGERGRFWGRGHQGGCGAQGSDFTSSSALHPIDVVKYVVSLKPRPPRAEVLTTRCGFWGPETRQEHWYV